MSKLKLIPIGGLGEIGRNMMVLEYDEDIIVIDAGIMFPEEDMLGIDLVIPDISYLLKNRERVRGIIITHGHEDHVGALPYVLTQLNVPVYSTGLAQGIISVKLKESRTAPHNAKLIRFEAGDTFKLGKFVIESFPVCHSIPDAVGFIIQTPVGKIVHTGDFKIDYTPVDGKPTNLNRLAQVGGEGVLLLLSDSTYAEAPGYTASEKVVGDTLEQTIANATGRVIITTFASLVSRMQQVIDAASRHNRRVSIVGRSMVDIARMALKMGYLRAPDGILGQIEEMRNLPPEKVVILTTGSQGEPTSGLVRIANKDHRQISIIPGDAVIISASPIPGNESLVNRTIDSLLKQGAKVYYDKVAPVHVHGHASQEELKLILNLIRPRFFVPVHGEYRHLSQHAQLAQSLGMTKENIFVLEDGDILEINRDKASLDGKITLNDVYVDGLSVGEIGGVVLQNRRMLSHDGVVVVIMTINHQAGRIVGQPEVVSSGFVNNEEAKGEEIMEQARQVVAESLNRNQMARIEGEWASNKAKEALSRFLYEKTGRHPVILPVVLDA